MRVLILVVMSNAFGCVQDSLVPCRGDQLCPPDWKPITYPGACRDARTVGNAIHPEISELQLLGRYCMAAEMGINTSLVVTITRDSSSGGWSFEPGAIGVWQVSAYDEINHTQRFEVTTEGYVELDGFSVVGEGDATMEVYEYAESAPSFAKPLHWRF